MNSDRMGLSNLKLVFLLMASLLSARAAEWKSDTHGFSVNLPRDWQQVDSPNKQLPLVARDPKTARRLMVKVVPADGETAWATVLAGLKRGFERSGGKMGDERRFDLQGVSACEVITTSEHEGTQMKSLMRMCIHGDKVYLVHYIWKAEQSAEAEAHTFLDSFRLLNRPVAPQHISLC